MMEQQDIVGRNNSMFDISNIADLLLYIKCCYLLDEGKKCKFGIKINFAVNPPYFEEGVSYVYSEAMGVSLPPSKSSVNFEKCLLPNS